MTGTGHALNPTGVGIKLKGGTGNQETGNMESGNEEIGNEENIAFA